MLQAGNCPDVRIAVHEALVCLVLDKCGAEEHDVVKLTSERAAQLVQKVLCLTRIGGSNDQSVERQLSWVHASLYECVFWQVVLYLLEGQCPAQLCRDVISFGASHFVFT